MSTRTTHLARRRLAWAPQPAPVLVHVQRRGERNGRPDPDTPCGGFHGPLTSRETNRDDREHGSEEAFHAAVDRGAIGFDERRSGVER
jgi:hypothetical protein